MSFTVWIKPYGSDPIAVKEGTTAKQARRLLGSYISGKRRIRNLEEAYATGRFGWRYSQKELPV